MNLSEFIITNEEYRKGTPQSIQKAMEALDTANFTISAGYSGGFWNNVRCEAFASDFLVQLLKKLHSIILQTKKKEKDPYSYTPEADQYIIAIAHLVTTYNYLYPEEIWRPRFEELEALNVPQITSVFIALEKHVGSLYTSFKQSIDDILDESKSAQLNLSIPLFTLKRILNVIYLSQKSFWFNVAGLKARLTTSNTVDQSIVLLHLLRVMMTLYPGYSGIELQCLLPAVKDYIAKPSPVSDVACQIGIDIEREGKYPGAAYYSSLNSILSDNSAFDGAVPLLFDAKCSFFTNMIYSKSPQFDTISNCLINFLDFFVRAKFRANVALKTERAIAVLSMLTFDDDGMEYVQKKLKIKGKQIPDDEFIDADDVMPPTFNYVPIRLSVVYPVNSNYLIPLPNSPPMFGTPMPIILKSNLIKPVLDRLKSLPDDTQLLQQPVILAGDDLMIGHVMTGIFAAIAENPQDFARVIFKWYIVPIDPNSVNEIASFMSKADPIYKRFVFNSYDLCTSIKPTMDESSNVDFPSVIEDKSAFPAHSWFTDPSPANLFQFSLNHYLLFGRDTISISLWRADLELADEKATHVTVPWLTSLHVGDTFAGNSTLEPVPPFPSKLQANLTIVEPCVGPYTELKMKLKALSIWNVQEEMNMRPTNDWFLVEWTKENVNFKKGERRATHAKKITSKVAIELNLNADGPFKIMIDQRIYENVKKITVTKLIDPTTLSLPAAQQEQMKLRIASFCNSL